MAQNFNIGTLGQVLAVNTAANATTYSTLVTFTNTAISANAIFYNNGEAPGYTYFLDDISSNFDCSNKTFSLSINNGTYITPKNPNMIQLYIGNVPVAPTRTYYDYVYQSPIPTFTSGYIVNGSNLVFATAPLQNMSFYGTYRTSQDQAPIFSYNQTPFKAINIMLGT